MKAPSTRAARERLSMAMLNLDDAGVALDRAHQHLASVRGASDLYDKCGRIRDQAATLWAQLDRAVTSRDGMSLDSEPEPVSAGGAK